VNFLSPTQWKNIEMPILSAVGCGGNTGHFLEKIIKNLNIIK